MFWRYFWLLPDKLTENADFANIKNPLKNEVYEKMDTEKLYENVNLL